MLDMLVDSHCHLDFKGLAEARAGFVVRALEAGVGIMVNVGTRRSDCDKIVATAEEFESVYCAVGTHPHHAGEEGEVLSASDIARLAAHPKVIGIGETGLDYFYAKSPKEAQEKSFREHIRAAKAAGLPVVIHSRDAEEDTIRIMKEEGLSAGVLHCFSSGRFLAEEGLKLGLYVSLSGIITFKKSEALRDIVRDVPLDRLLVETDSPYLAPEPYRGQQCEPAYVVRTAQVLADIKGVSFEEIAKATTENFFRLFSKCPVEDAA